MRVVALSAVILFSLTSQAGELRSPKTIVFQPRNAPAFTVTFDGSLPIDQHPGETTFQSSDQPTDTCDIATESARDGLVFLGHRFMDTDVRVTMGNKQYFVTPAYGSGMEGPFGSTWWYCTTVVYTSSADCHSQANPLRILIGIYSTPNGKPVYTNEEDYKIGWGRDSDQAFLYTGDNMVNETLGKVTEWY